MREIGGICVGDGPKAMGGGIEAMAYAGPTPAADPPFDSAPSALIRCRRDMRAGNPFAPADAMRTGPRDLVEKAGE